MSPTEEASQQFQAWRLRRFPDAARMFSGREQALMLAAFLGALEAAEPPKEPLTDVQCEEIWDAAESQITSHKPPREWVREMVRAIRVAEPPKGDTPS